MKTIRVIKKFLLVLLTLLIPAVGILLMWLGMIRFILIIPNDLMILKLILIFVNGLLFSLVIALLIISFVAIDDIKRKKV